MNYKNEALCSKCGGACCKRHSGAATPEDIAILFPAPSIYQSICMALDSGKWIFDCWDGDPREGHKELHQAYYMRPRVDGDSGPFTASWGGQCIFLSSNGCTLGAEERPTTCRMLEPAPHRLCELHAGGKRQCSIDWLVYEPSIKKALWGESR